MKYMGEDLAVYRRSKTLRCFSGNGTVYGHNSGESLKWAPKVHGSSILISQAKGQSINNMMIHSKRVYLFVMPARMIIQVCFFSQSIFLYALAFLFTYLKHERVFIKKKEVMKKC